jgi:hypothetical protein
MSKYIIVFDDKKLENEYNTTIKKLLHIDNKDLDIINIQLDIRFWDIIKSCDFTNFEKDIKVLLLEFGSSLPTNRMNIGKIIEYKCSDTILEKLENIVLEDEKRYDLDFLGYGKLSIKYSSVSDIKLINSLGKNKDVKLRKTLIFTSTEMFLISNQLLSNYGINIKEYLKNTSDGLSLKRKLLTILKNTNYYFKRKIDLNINKKDCKNECLSKFLVNVIPWEKLKKKYEF